MRPVLVVDDSPSVRTALRRTLESAGYEVLVAADGERALVLAREHPLTAVIVDYNLPGMDGLRVLTVLRTMQPSVARLLVSASLDLNVLMQAVNRGEISRALVKPVHPKELLAAVSESVASRESVGKEWLADQDGARAERREALGKLFRTQGIKLAFQPIVRSEDRQVVAFEGLLRTEAILEDLGGPLATVLDVLQACEENDALHDLSLVGATLAAERLARLPSMCRIFLNLHPMQLASPDVLIQSLGPVRAYSHRVTLEITERSGLDDVEASERSIRALRLAGFQIAVDDLGAGASSLSALATIDPDVVKLDMSLVRDVDKEPRKRAVMEMLRRFATANGMLVVAEGIETEAEAEVVASAGVDLMQGFLLGRPALEPPRPPDAETEPAPAARHSVSVHAPRAPRSPSAPTEPAPPGGVVTPTD